jgi:DNA-binding phage protein
MVQNYYTEILISTQYIECLFLIVFDYLKQMSEVADSMLFRQKLYDTFKESGLLNKLKTTLRTNLLQKL